MDLISLIHQKSYEWATILLISGCVTWFIYFKLSFKIISEKMPPTIYPAILIMVAYVVCARPLIPNITFLILMCILMVVLLCIFGRLNIFKSIYGSFFTMFLSFLGNVFILSVILGLFSNLIPFIFGSKFGFIIGAAIELMFPLVALFLVPKYSLRLPLRKESEPFDKFDMAVSWILLCMYYVMDYALMTALEAFQKHPQNIGPSLGLLFMATLGILGGVVILIKCMKIIADREISRLQDEKEKAEREKARMEVEKNKAIKEMDTTIDFIQNIDPEVKQYLRESFIKIAEAWAKGKEQNETQAFSINYTNIAKFGVKENEAKVLAYLILHKTNEEIAQLMSYSDGYIKNIITDLNKKFGTKDRRQLSKIALDNQLVEIL